MLPRATSWEFAFREEVNRERLAELQVEVHRQELAEVVRKLDSLIEAMAEGYRSTGLQENLDQLESRKSALEQEAAEAAIPGSAPTPEPGHTLFAAGCRFA